MPTYVVKTLNLPPIVGFEATLAGGIAVTFLTPIAGMVSDRIGRTTQMIAINLLMLVSIAPTFLVVTRNPTAAIIIIAVFWLATLKALYFGPLAALMSELLPAASRATGLGLGYNIGVTVFGGMGPVFMTWLGGIALIGDLSPAYYLTVIGFISLAALVTIRTTNAASHGA
jgi:MHS family proline/betaine transporter-like MFS transporter